LETPRSLPEKVRRKLGEIDWKKVIPELVIVSIGLARLDIGARQILTSSPKA
jgi:hypothetical protein